MLQVLPQYIYVCLHLCHPRMFTSSVLVHTQNSELACCCCMILLISVCVPRRSTPGQPGGRWNWEKGGNCQFISATLLVFLLCWQFGDTEDTMFHCASEVTTLWRYTNLFIVIIITAICLLFTAEQTCCRGLQKCIRVFIPLCHVSMLFQQTVDLLFDMMLVHYSIPIRDSNRFDSLCESIRFVKKSAFQFTSCYAVFALNK